MTEQLRRGPRRRISSWVLCALVVAFAFAAAAPQADARVPKRFFGANALYPTPGDFGSMERSGIGTYRFVIYWQGAQSEPHGAYNWGQADRQIYPAIAAGLRPLPVLLGTPPFIGDDPSHLTPPIRTKLARHEWARFVEAAVDRYRPGGSFWTDHPELPKLPPKDWQIWNEQNAAGYWYPQANPREYARLLKISDKAIGKADPKARVMLGGMYGYPSSAAVDLRTKVPRRPLQAEGRQAHVRHRRDPPLRGLDSAWCAARSASPER